MLFTLILNIIANLGNQSICVVFITCKVFKELKTCRRLRKTGWMVWVELKWKTYEHDWRNSNLKVCGRSSAPWRCLEAEFSATSDHSWRKQGSRWTNHLQVWNVGNIIGNNWKNQSFYVINSFLSGCFTMPKGHPATSSKTRSIPTLSTSPEKTIEQYFLLQSPKNTFCALLHPGLTPIQPQHPKGCSWGSIKMNSGLREHFQ